MGGWGSAPGRAVFAVIKLCVFLVSLQMMCEFIWVSYRRRHRGRTDTEHPPPRWKSILEFWTTFLFGNVFLFLAKLYVGKKKPKKQTNFPLKYFSGFCQVSCAMQMESRVSASKPHPLANNHHAYMRNARVSVCGILGKALNFGGAQRIFFSWLASKTANDETMHANTRRLRTL